MGNGRKKKVTVSSKLRSFPLTGQPKEKEDFSAGAKSKAGNDSKRAKRARNKRNKAIESSEDRQKISKKPK